METKSCGRCKAVKPYSKFNKDKNTPTGLRSQCKQCMKAERLRLKDHYKAFRDSEKGKEYYRNYRRANYDKVKALARNLCRSLEKQPCEVCGSSVKPEAHHDDYSKPLDVRWLCFDHHRQWHTEND